MSGPAQASEDERAIRELIARQFRSMSWSPGAPADWSGFAGDFLHRAALFPSARPLSPTDVAAFVERMRRLSETSLQSFDEVVLGAEIQVFGNVAVAAVACEAVENADEVGRTVEMMLLVKTEEGWRIAAQAWDKASTANPVPARYLSGFAVEG